MEIQVNEVEYCKMDVDCLASMDEITSKKNEVLKSFKNAPVPGFRKGKASLNDVGTHYKKQIQESLKRAMAEEAYHNFIFEKNVKPLSQPSFTNVFLNNSSFECKFSIYTKPVFELKEYKNFEVPKAHAVLSESDFVEDVLQKLRVKHGTSASFSEHDFVQEKDALVINYVGSVDGVEAPELTASGELIQLGNPSLKYFETNLLGMKVGESRSFKVQVEDGNPNFIGKEVTFSVDLLSGSKNVANPLDDEFAKKVNFENLEALRTNVHGLYTQYVSEQTRSQMINQVSARLVANHDFKVPEFLSAQEAKYLAHGSRANWDDLADEEKAALIEKAEKNVKLSLVLDKVREEEPEAQLSEEETLDFIRKHLTMYFKQGDVEAHIQKMFKTGELTVFAQRVRDEHVLDFVVKTCKQVE